MEFYEIEDIYGVVYYINPSSIEYFYATEYGKNREQKKDVTCIHLNDGKILYTYLTPRELHMKL